MEKEKLQEEKEKEKEGEEMEINKVMEQLETITGEKKKEEKEEEIREEENMEEEKREKIKNKYYLLEQMIVNDTENFFKLLKLCCSQNIQHSVTHERNWIKQYDHKELMTIHKKFKQFLDYLEEYLKYQMIGEEDHGDREDTNTHNTHNTRNTRENFDNIISIFIEYFENNSQLPKTTIIEPIQHIKINFLQEKVMKQIKVNYSSKMVIVPHREWLLMDDVIIYADKNQNKLLHRYSVERKKSSCCYLVIPYTECYLFCPENSKFECTVVPYGNLKLDENLSTNAFNFPFYNWFLCTCCDILHDSYINTKSKHQAMLHAAPKAIPSVPPGAGSEAALSDDKGKPGQEVHDVHDASSTIPVLMDKNNKSMIRNKLVEFIEKDQIIKDITKMIIQEDIIVKPYVALLLCRIIAARSEYDIVPLRLLKSEFEQLEPVVNPKTNKMRREYFFSYCELITCLNYYSALENQNEYATAMNHFHFNPNSPSYLFSMDENQLFPSDSEDLLSFSSPPNDFDASFLKEHEKQEEEEDDRDGDEEMDDQDHREGGDSMERKAEAAEEEGEGMEVQYGGEEEEEGEEREREEEEEGGISEEEEADLDEMNQEEKEEVVRKIISIMKDFEVDKESKGTKSNNNQQGTGGAQAGGITYSTGGGGTTTTALGSNYRGIAATGGGGAGGAGGGEKNKYIFQLIEQYIYVIKVIPILMENRFPPDKLLNHLLAFHYIPTIIRESEHPYKHSQRERIYIPGAKKLSIYFDPRCKLDYIDRLSFSIHNRRGADDLGSYFYQTKVPFSLFSFPFFLLFFLTPFIHVIGEIVGSY